MNVSSSWQEVVKNILYFTQDLLPGATSRSNWTCEGVDRAVSWGRYCERAAGRLTRNGNIVAALAHTAGDSDLGSTILQLHDARCLLLGLLLKNQLLEEGVKQHVQQVAVTSLGPDVTASLTSQAAQQEEAVKSLLYQLKEPKFSDVRQRLRTRLMLESYAASGQDKLVSCLSKIAFQPEGFSVIIDILVEEDRGTSNSIQAIATTWIKEILSNPHNKQHRVVLRQVCSLPSERLTKLLNDHPDILTIFLNTLQREVVKLEPFYDSEVTNWLPRDPASSILSYPDLTNTCTALLADPSLGELLMAAVPDWSIGLAGAVWADILRDAK